AFFVVDGDAVHGEDFFFGLIVVEPAGDFDRGFESTGAAQLLDPIAVSASGDVAGEDAAVNRIDTEHPRIVELGFAGAKCAPSATDLTKSFSAGGGSYSQCQAEDNQERCDEASGASIFRAHAHLSSRLDHQQAPPCPTDSSKL